MSRSSSLAFVCTALLFSAIGLSACPPSGGGRVAVNPCANGVQDINETGVDCGGTCGACAGTTCADASECASHSCAATVCAAPTCSDGIKNGTEPQIDCGGTCGACKPATCSNSVQDPNETGVDCGGPCAACVIGNTCQNQVQDPDEDGVDCGGPCTPCGQEPTCSDTIQNQDESDKDCGGLSCPKCGTGKTCKGPSDCTTSVCDNGTCGAAGPTCANGEQDAGETDKDCGGPCPACPTGKVCGGHNDCLSATCVFGVCRDPSCSDDVLNQGESAVDCGGPKCGPCDDGKACRAVGDCKSGACEDSVCVSCGDGTMNQDESDKDCGGGCEDCGNDKACNSLDDCQSRTCINGFCKPEGSNAGICAVESDCDNGFFCEYLWNEEAGSAAALDHTCLVERDGAQPGTACTVYEDCAGFGCFNNFCSAACRSDAECGAGAVCANEENLFDTDGDDSYDVLLNFEYCLKFDNGSGSCLSHSSCATGKRCTIYLEQNLSGQSLDPDGPYKALGKCEKEVAGGAVEGAACEIDNDCKSGVCSSQGICSRYCEAASECAPVTVQNLGTLKRVCSNYPAWAGASLDDPSGFVRRSECVAFTGTNSLTPCGPSTATPFKCATDGDFCAEFSVAFGPDYKAKAEYLCLGGEGSTELGGSCTNGDECQSGYCIPDANGDGSCGRPCAVGSDTCDGVAGVTCKAESLVTRKGKYLANGLTVGFCRR